MRWVFLLACLLILAPHMSTARTWDITPDGTGDAPTIQAGIDSAATGDTIVLASGTYTGAGNRDVDFLGKAVTVRSESRVPADCIVDCEGEGRGFIFDTAEGQMSQLEGITIKNGHDLDQGGAVYIGSYSAPTIRNCKFISNSSGLSGEYGIGGAIYVYYDASPTISNCEFISNSSGYSGGAIHSDAWYWDGRITGCTFIGNTSPGGGAIYCYGQNPGGLTADSCLFRENTALSGGSIAHGEGHDIGEFRHCTFHANSAEAGGAVGIGPGGATFSYCTFHANTAERGGAASFGGGGANFEGCTFVANSAGTGSAVSCYSDASPTLLWCIIAYGVGGAGVYVDPASRLTPGFECSDLYGNEGGDWVGRIAGELGNNGNFSACPSFCNAHLEPYDFHLCDESPCLPGNHPDGAGCGLIGAWDQGCACGPTQTEETTWGRIKATFR
ncbi:MAG: right-handed parallel beta-helix repeat-containing protein [Candidatus Eisenbacteria bacterium]